MTGAAACTAAAAAAFAAAPAPALPEMDRVLATFEDVAAAQAKLDAGAARLEELIRRWAEQVAAPAGGTTITFNNQGMQATNVVQGQESYAQSAITKEGGTATVYNISGAALTPEMLKALNHSVPRPPAKPPFRKASRPRLNPCRLPVCRQSSPASRFCACRLPYSPHLQPTRLRQMVLVGLDEHLEHIAGGSTFSAVTFNLIDWAQRAGRLPALLQAAHAAAPGSPELNAFLGQFRV